MKKPWAAGGETGLVFLRHHMPSTKGGGVIRPARALPPRLGQQSSGGEKALIRPELTECSRGARTARLTWDDVDGSKLGA